ncbi:unnamed protein product [Amoebophrya sp. A25]|nr:unnamed protein product [Amoebophrya sp. A25]|eukprot:GSA25T00027205001.1
MAFIPKARKSSSVKGGNKHVGKGRKAATAAAAILLSTHLVDGAILKGDADRRVTERDAEQKVPTQTAFLQQREDCFSCSGDKAAAAPASDPAPAPMDMDMEPEQEPPAQNGEGEGEGKSANEDDAKDDGEELDENGEKKDKRSWIQRQWDSWIVPKQKSLFRPDMHLRLLSFFPCISVHSHCIIFLSTKQVQEILTSLLDEAGSPPAEGKKL